MCLIIFWRIWFQFWLVLPCSFQPTQTPQIMQPHLHFSYFFSVFLFHLAVMFLLSFPHQILLIILTTSFSRLIYDLLYSLICYQLLILLLLIFSWLRVLSVVLIWVSSLLYVLPTFLICGPEYQNFYLLTQLTWVYYTLKKPLLWLITYRPDKTMLDSYFWCSHSF